jgi:hypothetical protein
VGNVRIHAPPPMNMMMEITIATMGRLMKNLDI